MAKVENKVDVDEVVLTMTEREAEVLIDVLGRVELYFDGIDEVDSMYDALYNIIKENK